MRCRWMTSSASWRNAPDDRIRRKVTLQLPPQIAPGEHAMTVILEDVTSGDE